MIQDLEEICNENLIKLHELKSIVSFLNECNMKPLKVQQVFNNVVVIETKSLQKQQNCSTLIIKVKNYSRRNDILQIASQSYQSKWMQLLADKQHKEYLFIDIPYFEQTIQDRISDKCINFISRDQILQILQSILYIVAALHKNDTFQGINKESIIFLKDGKNIFINQCSLFLKKKIQKMIEKNIKNDYLYLLAPEILKKPDEDHKSKSDIYTLGLIFLEMLGLNITQQTSLELKSSNYQCTTNLPHQDLVKVIIKYMICVETEKRLSAIQLFWIFKLQINREQLDNFEKCQFIQSQINLNLDQLYLDIESDNTIQHKKRFISEYKTILSGIPQLEKLNLNGCIVKQITKQEIEILIVGVPGSLFEDKIIRLTLDLLTNNYPYQPLICRLVSDITSLPFIKDRKINIDILHQNWSPASTIAQIIISIASIINAKTDDNTLYCEANVIEVKNQSELESQNLEKIQDLYNEYEINFQKQYPQIELD